ncbi:hypothetical protein GCM10023185_35140 [Hymenobacter saemangeumensis]|uniref:XRE family transcriptional regulator n=1 Tax=Hymenobacter saemangeumensis TaxID=1084522 RepID=A0ABP8IPB2_9BACT
MPDYVRNKFGLTQERLASWLGTSRGMLAQSEAGTKSLPGRSSIASARLVLASLGKVLVLGQAEAQPGPPPLPVPAPKLEPLRWRRDECRYRSGTLRRELAAMQAKAQQLENRLAALPSLRAYPGPVSNPAREAGWLALFEGEAEDGLRDACGAGPQRLLEARIAGLEREAELLEELLNELPPIQ